MGFYGNRFLNENNLYNLSEKQTENVKEILNEKFSKIIEKSKENNIKKYKRLKSVSYNNKTFKFRYDKYYKEFVCYIEGFGNYAYEENLKGENAIKSIDEFGKDLNSLIKDINQELKQYKLKINTEDDEGYNLTEYIKYMKKYIINGTYVPSNAITVSVHINPKYIKSFIPSENQIKENEKKKYLQLYDEFVKFLKNPHKLQGNLWSGTIRDICEIVGISSEKLNNIVSSNIKNMNVYSFKNKEDEFKKYLQKQIGDHYIIENDFENQIVYSISKKKLYYINYEHEECEIFFNNYPFNSKEFEDIVFDNGEELKSVRNLFKEYDKNKKYNIISE